MSTDLQALIGMLGNKRAESRNQAAKELRRLGPRAKEAVPALISALGQLDSRSDVIVALRAIGPDAKECVPALFEILNDESEEVLSLLQTADAILDIGKLEGITGLITTLRSSGTTSRRVAASSLERAKANAEIVVPVLIGALNDEIEGVRDAAARSLVGFGSRSVSALKEALSSKVALIRTHSGFALVNIHEGKYGAVAVDAIMNDVTHDNVDVRRCAVSTCENAGRHAKKALSVLAKALCDSDEKVRESAVCAIGHIGPAAKVAIPILLEIIKESSGWASVFAMQSLGTFGSSAKIAVPTLMEFLKSPDGLERQFAAEGLGGIGPAAKEALPLLKVVAKSDEYSDIKEAAAHAVKAISSKRKWW